MEQWLKAQKGELHFWSQKERKRNREQVWKQFIQPFQKWLGAKKVVLDVGCGGTGLINYFDARMKVGIDPLIKEYKKIFDLPKDVHFIRATGESIPVRNGIADSVFCINTLDHTLNPEEILNEIQRVLRFQQHLILYVQTYPFHLRIYRKIFKPDPLHPHTFSKKKIELMLRGKNFEILRMDVEKNHLVKLIANKRAHIIAMTRWERDSKDSLR